MKFVKIFLREIKLILHDEGVMLFFLFLPLAYPVIYSLIYNPELVREVATVVVDNDRTALSREFVRRLDATQGARVIGYAPDMADAKKAVMEKEAYAIIEIPQGFGRAPGRMEQGIVNFYCEMSLLLRYRSLLFSLTDLSLAMGAELQTADISGMGAGSVISGDPMPVTTVAMGDITSGFDSFIMPGVLVLILQQCIILAVGMIGGGRRERIGKLYADETPLSRSVSLTLCGRGLAYLAVISLPVLWLLHYVPVVFRFPMAGNPWEIFAFILPMVLASISLGFIIQVFCRERESIFIIWVATSVLFLFLSGLTWPRFAMPWWARLLSDCVPATWGVNGFILMNANGSSLSQVSHDYLSLWILFGAYSLIAWAIHKFYLRKILS